MRSGFAVFSLSISAPQSPTTLSSSPAAIADMHAARSTGGTLLVSAPVACSHGEISTIAATTKIPGRIGHLSNTTAAPLRQSVSSQSHHAEIAFEPSHTRRDTTHMATITDDRARAAAAAPARIFDF